MVEVRGRTEVTWRKEALVPMSGDRCVSKMPEGEETGSSCERLEDMKRSHLQHHGVSCFINFGNFTIKATSLACPEPMVAKPHKGQEVLH